MIILFREARGKLLSLIPGGSACVAYVTDYWSTKIYQLVPGSSGVFSGWVTVSNGHIDLAL